MKKNKVVESFRTKNATYELQEVYCGKETCRKCPHGPYWYVKFRVKDRIITKYIGKQLNLVSGDTGFSRKKSYRLQPLERDFIIECFGNPEKE